MKLKFFFNLKFVLYGLKTMVAAWSLLEQNFFMGCYET